MHVGLTVVTSEVQLVAPWPVAQSAAYRPPRALPLGLAQLSPSHPISHLPTCPALFPSPELFIMHQLSRYVVFLLPLS